jgi:hypothetical protein
VLRCYILGVLIDWSREFGDYLDRLENQAEAGNERSGEMLDLINAQLGLLQQLPGAPREETASLRRVQQSRKHEIWRVSHPYVEGLAVRLIVWFPDDEPDTAVVALFAGEKARIGDVFYNSVGTRADAAIESWKYQTGEHS